MRSERPSDAAAIFAVHRAAFGGETEARLVDRLREGGRLTVSLVAEAEGDIVGHVGFSPVAIAGDPGTARALGLAPIGVLPSRQRTGIGTQLIRRGLAMTAAQGCDLVFVVGEPAYYRRFGFTPAAAHGLRWDRAPDLPEFMVLPLRPEALTGVRGLVRYDPVFGDV